MEVDEYVAILEDNAERVQAMRSILSDELAGMEAVIFENAEDMVRWLASHLSQVRLLSLDHDLPLRVLPSGQCEDCGDGMVVVEFLTDMPVICPVIVHTSNWVAGERMIHALFDTGWPVTRVVPHEDISWIFTDWRQAIQELKASHWLDAHLAGKT